MQQLTQSQRGILMLILGMAIFSLQNIAIKSISGQYAVLQIVLIRSFVALPILVFFYRLEGGRGIPRTQKLSLEMQRGLLLFVSYTTYFMGLAGMALADAAAIRFSAPLILTLMSVFILKEQVGIRRWSALLVGFTGVLLIVQPGTGAFNPASLFILLATTCYALSTMYTRRLRNDDSSATMAFYGTVAYLLGATVLVPIVALVDNSAEIHPSIDFLLREWTMPTLPHLAIIMGLGLIWASGMFCVSRAYSLAPASVAAPFEYVTLPINTMWGFLIWNEIPTIFTWIGAALTLGSGLYIWYREKALAAKPVPA